MADRRGLLGKQGRAGKVEGGELTFHGCAQGERVALVILGAAAGGDVRDNRALGVSAADADAGLHAFVVGARLVVRAVGVLHAFRPAFAVRVAAVLGYAPANAVAGAFGVGAARRRVARVVGLRRKGLCAWETRA